MRKALPLVVGLAALVWGCDSLTYSPDGENVVPVTPPDATVLRVDLGTPSDTLLIWGVVDLGYEAVARGRVVEVGVYLGDKLMGTADPEGRVRFDVSGLADGVYPLRVVAAATTGSGSLADRLGLEFATALGSRMAIVENGPPPLPDVRTRREDGALVVSWSRDRSRRFSRYVVTTDAYIRGAAVEVEILDRNQTEWVDSTYIGGTATYTVQVLIADGGGAAQSVTISEPLPQLLRAERIAPGRVRLAWTETPYTTAFSRYVIQRASSSREGGNQTFTVRDAGTTTFVDELPDAVFGESFHYTFTSWTTLEDARRREDSHAEVSARPNTGLTPQAYLPGSRAWVGVAAAETGGWSLLRYTDARGTEAVAKLPEDAHPITVVATPDGDRLFTTEGPFVRQRDASTLAVERTVDLGRLAGDGTRVGFGAVATTDGRLLFGYRRVEGFSSYYGPGVGVLDLDAPAYVGRFAKQDGTQFEGATSDGRYVLVRDYGAGHLLFERDAGGGFVQLATIPNDALYVVMTHENRLARLSGTTVSVLTLPELTVERTFAVAPGLRSLRYDEAGGGLYSDRQLSGGAENEVVLYDPATGSERGRVRVDGRVGSVYEEGYTVLAGRIWWEGFTQEIAPSPTASR